MLLSPMQAVPKMHYITLMVLVPNLLSNLINLSPVMQGTSKMDIIVKHVNAIHAAREAFIEVESKEKLCRALKAKN